MRQQPPNSFELIMWFCGGLVLLFIIAPLAGMALDCSFSSLKTTALDREVQRSIELTLICSFCGMAVCSLAAVPFAWLLARRDFKGKRILQGIIDLPVVIPHSAAGIALLGVLSRNSMLGGLGEYWGFSFIGSSTGIACAMAYVSLPFLIDAARDGFAAVPEQLEKAALTLGASPARVFFTISMPLAKRAIMTGLVMMFARGLSEFGAVIIIAYHPMVAPVLIYERFTSFGLAHSQPIAVVFLGVCLLVFIVLRLLAGERRNAID
jgi:molybdate/tungstate transport system permease protein